MMMNSAIQATGEATAVLPVANTEGKPITVIGTPAIRETFDDKCIEQAINSRTAPGVTDLVLNADAHCGYGAPVGCVLVSPTHVYPGPVGVDIKRSMSFLQLDLPVSEVKERPVRRALIDALLKRTPTGPGKGQRSVPLARRVSPQVGKRVAAEGKDFNEVLRSVELAGLASTVARLKARFVMKDTDVSLGGAA